jgi:hypothetical protein
MEALGGTKHCFLTPAMAKGRTPGGGMEGFDGIFHQQKSTTQIKAGKNRLRQNRIENGEIIDRKGQTDTD